MTLCTIATMQIHAAYAAFSHGLSSKWLYLARACAGLENYIAPIEVAIRNNFLPALTGHAISDLERELLALPVRSGGLGLSNPVTEAPAASNIATKITQPLVEHLQGTSSASITEVFAHLLLAYPEARREKNARLRTQAANVRAKLPNRL